MRAKVALGLVPTADVAERRQHRTRNSAAQWAKIIAAQRRSSLTIVEFCRRRNLALATFGYWRRRLAKPAIAATAAQRFLAVPLVALSAAPIEVELGTLHMRLDGAAAVRLVDALVAWGTPDQIREAVDRHRDAGANHVCVQVLRADTEIPLDDYRRLAKVLVER